MSIEDEISAKMLLFKQIVANTKHDISWWDSKKHSLDALVDWIEWQDYLESQESNVDPEHDYD